MSSIKRVMTGDWLDLQDALCTFLNWYQRECDNLEEIGEAWRESKADILVSVLSAGLTELKIRTSIIREADRIEKEETS